MIIEMVLVEKTSCLLLELKILSAFISISYAYIYLKDYSMNASNLFSELENTLIILLVDFNCYRIFFFIMMFCMLKF